MGAVAIENHKTLSEKESASLNVKRKIISQKFKTITQKVGFFSFPHSYIRDY